MYILMGGLMYDSMMNTFDVVIEFVTRFIGG